MATEEFGRPEACLPKINSWTSFSFSSLSSSNSASMSLLRLNAALSSLGLRLESALCSSSAMFSGEEIGNHTFNSISIASYCQSARGPTDRRTVLGQSQELLTKLTPKYLHEIKSNRRATRLT